MRRNAAKYSEMQQKHARRCERLFSPCLPAKFRYNAQLPGCKGLARQQQRGRDREQQGNKNTRKHKEW
jgi:hypothetical protein